MIQASLTLQEDHAILMKSLLLCSDGLERSAYLLCGRAFIAEDPWDGQPHYKFVSYEVVPIPDNEIISASPAHVTWKTDSLVQVLKQAQVEALTVAIFHSHPGGLVGFSEQDDANEPDLLELAQNRNGLQTQLLSVVLTPSGELVGRLWINKETHIPLQMIRVVGKTIRPYYSGRGEGIPSPAFHRQSLVFGDALTQDLSMLRVGVVGCGGTGSAIAMQLPRMGVRKIALFDQDIVEVTNLNRLYGAEMPDAEARRSKVEVVAEDLEKLGFGVEAKTYQHWISNPVCRDALKACDVVFGCTDDHAGRLLLNRFAYFYSVPIIDMGLAIEVSRDTPPRILACDGRVTVLGPRHTCLLCHKVISPVRAGEEALKRNNPEEYERRKAEAYVLGEGNPSPAIVIFTTQLASMAIEELVHRLQGFRDAIGPVDHRIRKFHLLKDLRSETAPDPHCRVCGSANYWGRGDIVPFLDRVE